MYWRLTHGPLKPIVIIGFALLFVVIASSIAFVYWLELRDSAGSFFERYLHALGFTVAVVLPIALAIAVIRNYRRQKKSSRHE